MRHIVETTFLNGTKESTVHELEGSRFLIGRGSDCQIRLSSRLVSLNHAELTLQDGTLSVRDLDSLGGVRVNGAKVQVQRLSAGDILRVGETNFSVSREKAVWCLTEHREETKHVDTDVTSRVDAEVKRLDISAALPSMLSLSLGLSIVVAVIFFALPLAGLNLRSWNSGPISSSHKIIENDCAACHDQAFVQVQDRACLSCHAMSEHDPQHASWLEAHPEDEIRCASCHMEHNGDKGLIADDSHLCTSCHASIADFQPPGEEKSSVQAVPSFDEHPEFQVLARFLKAPEGETYGAHQKVSLAEDPADGTPLKLNHKVHLEPDLAGPDSLVTLECADCHELSKGLKEVNPISFEAHCESCHKLEYDGRLPGKSVPHATPEVVFNSLYAEYAKLFLAEDGKVPEPFRKRIRPGQKRTRAEKIEFAREAVLRESRKVEEQLFTKTACHLCHYSEKMNANPSNPMASLYEVKAPNVPEKWLPSSVFDHGAHQLLGCDSCHAGVRTSESTEDLLLPQVAYCQNCHADNWEPSKVESPCISCHSYHQPLLLESENKKALEEVSQFLMKN